MDIQDSSCLVLFCGEELLGMLASLGMSSSRQMKSQKRPENGACAMQVFLEESGAKWCGKRHRSWSGCDAITTPLFAFRHKEPEKVPKREVWNIFDWDQTSCSTLLASS